MSEVGRGGHGGHGGGARGGFGFPYVTAEPWVYDPDFLDDERRRRVTGQELLSTGEGAIVVLALLWYLVHEADKRVPR